MPKFLAETYAPREGPGAAAARTGDIALAAANPGVLMQAARTANYQYHAKEKDHDNCVLCAR